MASYRDIRAALAAALEPLPGVETSAYLLANPTLPMAWVKPGRTDLHQTFGKGVKKLSFRVQVLVGVVFDIAAQDRLDEILEDNVVQDALEADPTLGGLVDDVTVTAIDDYDFWRVESLGLVLKADYLVDVLT